MFEFFYILFYFSGILKVFSTPFFVPPVDYTLLSVLTLVISVFFDRKFRFINISLNTIQLKSIIALIAIQALYFCSLVYTVSPDYSVYKSVILSSNIIAFAAPLLYYPFNIRIVTKSIVLITFITSIIYVLFFFTYLKNGSINDNFRALGGMYLMLGGMLGIIILILHTSQEIIFSSTLDKLIKWFSFIILVLIGARGPLLFLVITLIAIHSKRLFLQFTQGMIKINLRVLRIKNLVISSISILLVTVVSLVFQEYIQLLYDRTIHRFSLLFNAVIGDNAGVSVNTRVNQLILSIELIFSDPLNFLFGFGSGSFGMLETGIDHRAYPHNIFLETWIDIGLLGFLILSYFFFLLFRNKNNNQIIHHSLIFYILLNCLKSNSIIDLRIYFVIFGLYFINQTYCKKSIQI